MIYTVLYGIMTISRLKWQKSFFFGNTHAAFIAPFFYLIIAGFLIGSTFLRNKSNVFRPILWLFLGVNAIALLAALVTYILGGTGAAFT